MQGEGSSECGGGLIRQAKFFGSFAYDWRQVAEVDVANLRKQVMFDLVIQSTTHPSKNARTCAEVGGRFQLVRKAIVFHARPFFSFGEVQVFQNMCGLENGSEDEACYGMHDHPTDQYLPEWQATEQRRQDHDVSKVEDLGDDQVARKLPHGVA